MYLPGQIIYDLDKKVPVCIGPDVWDVEAYPKRSTHFVRHTGQWSKAGDLYELATPRTVAEAQDLLDKNLIVPAPCPPSHCWKCGNWKSNCSAFKTCSEWETSTKENKSCSKSSSPCSTSGGA